MIVTDPVVPDDVTASGSTAIRLDGVSKAVGSRADAVVALDGIDLEVRRGEFLCLVGASGLSLIHI